MFGSRGNQPGQFYYPTGIAINSRDEILMSDNDNLKIRSNDIIKIIIIIFI